MILETLIFAKQDFSSKDAVIQFVAAQADKEGLLASRDDFLQAVCQREEEISTSLGYGLAIPHGKTDAVRRPFLSFVSTVHPFRWDDASNDEVEAVFLIGVPKTNTETLHLKAIAAISKKLMDEHFREKLYTCQTSHEAYRMLRDIDEKITGK